MKGRYEITIQNSLVQFKFEISRNLTILRGDSATGKSTMVDLVRQHSLNGENSGVNISCKKDCTVLTGIRWETEISGIKDSIIFLDEGFDFVSSKEFADAVSRSDNPLEMNACLPGCVWNATPRSLPPPERNIGFWTQA